MTNTNGASSNRVMTNGSARRSGGMSDYYNGSMMSAETDHTYLTSPGVTQAYIENSSLASNNSHDGGSSQVSLLNGNSSNGSQSTIACYGDDLDDLFGNPGVLELNNTRLIFQGEIGRVSRIGNFLEILI